MLLWCGYIQCSYESFKEIMFFHHIQFAQDPCTQLFKNDAKIKNDGFLRFCPNKIFCLQMIKIYATFKICFCILLWGN